MTPLHALEMNSRPLRATLLERISCEDSFVWDSFTPFQGHRTSLANGGFQASHQSFDWPWPGVQGLSTVTKVPG